MTSTLPIKTALATMAPSKAADLKVAAANTQSPNRTRLALSVLAGAIGIALLAFCSSIADLSDRGSAIRQKAAELQALRQRAGARNAGAVTAANPFLEGANDSIASNALQERVVRLIENAGGNVISVNVEPQAVAQPAAADNRPGRRLILQTMAEMTVESLQRVLHRLEGEAPALIVESLLIDRRTTGTADGEDPTRPTRLRIDLRLAGFARSGVQ